MKGVETASGDSFQGLQAKHPAMSPRGRVSNGLPPASGTLGASESTIGHGEALRNVCPSR